jgi:hypothetical protein
MVLHQGEAGLVVGGVAHVSARLAERPAEGPPVKAGPSPIALGGSPLEQLIRGFSCDRERGGAKSERVSACAHGPPRAPWAHAMRERESGSAGAPLAVRGLESSRGRSHFSHPPSLTGRTDGGDRGPAAWGRGPGAGRRAQGGGLHMFFAILVFLVVESNVYHTAPNSPLLSPHMHRRRGALLCAAALAVLAHRLVVSSRRA